MRVLAIDDNADNLVALTALLRGVLPGCETAGARSGPDGLEKARTFRPDTILLDIQMPGMDGFEVCRRLKAAPETRHIPVVFVTALSATPASRTTALECGGDAFLAKPVEPGELLAQVRAMVRLKLAEDALRAENRTLEQLVAARTADLEEGRRLLAAIVDGTPDSVWIKDRGGRFLLANAAALRGLGRPSDQVLGRTAAELLGAAAAAPQEAADARVRASGEICSEDEQVTERGRTRTFVAVRGPVRDAEGRVTGVFGVVRDISDRARARLVLQKETERVQALLALYRDPGRTADDVVAAAVQGLVTLTGSRHGLIGLPAAGGDHLLAQAWPLPPHGPGPTPGRPFQHLLRDGDPWSEALRTGQPAALDGPVAGAQRDFPGGHPPVQRLLVVPVVRDGRVVLVGGMADREEPYGELDVGQAGLYLEGVWEALQKVRAEEQRAALEQQLRQAAKMEAVGRLAGGVAHDFNNLLSVILSYSRFAIESLGEGEPLRQDLQEILRAGERAATLTRQLLAHSRKQVLQVSTLDLNEVVAGLEPMLRRLLGEDLELHLALADGLWPVRADRGQLEQVVVNLAANARDAMPQGGRVTIRTGNLPAGREPGGGPWDGPGVLLEVADAGVGMDELTRSRAFEPFFTTKALGQGTGLGLATVYGIVKQSGGDVRVESAPGAGTTLSIVLPREEATRDAAGPVGGPAGGPEVGPPAPAPSSDTATAPVRGQETILVVEDEAAVRALTERILAGAGYRVVTAASGAEALELFARRGHEVRLLLTDAVMPQMSGHGLAQRLVRLRPDLKVVYMSGYLDDVLGRHGVLPSEIRFIGKPFAPADLARLVRQVLDEGPSAVPRPAPRPAPPPEP